MRQRLQLATSRAIRRFWRRSHVAHLSLEANPLSLSLSGWSRAGLVRICFTYHPHARLHPSPSTLDSRCPEWSSPLVLSGPYDWAPTRPHPVGDLSSKLERQSRSSPSFDLPVDGNSEVASQVRNKQQQTMTTTMMRQSLDWEWEKTRRMRRTTTIIAHVPYRSASFASERLRIV